MPRSHLVYPQLLEQDSPNSRKEIPHEIRSIEGLIIASTKHHFCPPRPQIAFDLPRVHLHANLEVGNLDIIVRAGEIAVRHTQTGQHRLCRYRRVRVRWRAG